MSFVVLHDSHSFLLSVNHVWNSGKEKLEQAAEEVARGDRSLTKLANFTSQFDVEILCQYLGGKGCKGFDFFYVYLYKYYIYIFVCWLVLFPKFF